MNDTPTAEPQTLHAIPGRLRAHLPAWAGRGPRLLERELRQVRGVRRAEANPVTRNVLVIYDAQATGAEAVRAALARAARQADEAPADDPPPPPVLKEGGSGPTRRARIAVRGLDRDPDLARRVVERLQRHSGVRARANPLTGRVLVEYDRHRVELQDLLADVAGLELPELPGEDTPAHPLDPAPLAQAAMRTAGAALGMGVLVLRRLLGYAARPRGARRAAIASGIIGLLRGYPTVRNGLRRLMGENAADLAFGSANIVSLTFAASPVGLLVTGAEAVLLLREVLARRAAWYRFEERLEGTPGAEPGAVVRLEAGERVPRSARVVEGTGTAVGRAGLPQPLAPGAEVHAGARLAGGPFVVELQAGRAFVPQPRPESLAPNLYARYIRALGPVSLGYAALTAVLTRSLPRTFAALLLVNPRAAIIGMESANLAAASRVLRAGVTVVGTRARRAIRRPDVVLLDGPRVLADGLEVSTVLPMTEAHDTERILALATATAAAAGAPWGGALGRGATVPAADGTFDGAKASAVIDGVRYTLGPVEPPAPGEKPAALPQRGVYWLLLRREGEEWPLALLALRPRLAAGVNELVQTCRRHGVRLELLPGGDVDAARAVARRAEVELVEAPVLGRIRAHQADGRFVLFVSDHADAAPALAACDLGVGLSSGRGAHFPARADLLAPDLAALAAVVESGVRRERAVRDSVLFSAGSNLFGAAWGLRGRPGVERASLAVYVSALGALADGWLRLRGGERSGSSLAFLVDPRPERWGRRTAAQVLRALRSRATGLTAAEASARRRAAPRAARRRELLNALLDQLRSPVNGILAAGGFLALLAGKALDMAIIGLTVGANVAIGAWQERQASHAAEALRRLGGATARVLRGGVELVIPAAEVVSGDVLLLAPGDRVAADARLLAAHGLEVDEASLTGESLPVAKRPEGGPPEGRIVLEGSDVAVGTGRAVAVAVGRQTRLGATAAALELEGIRQSPLGARLARMLGQAVPLAVAGGGLVIGCGLLWGHGLMTQVGVGISIALSVVPESLPLLAGTGQVGVARRLATRGALLRRLSAVEALGRVDIVCTDKTGTLTEGRLALRLLSDGEREASLPGPLPEGLRDLLRTAALACPHPDAPDRAAHPTDVAVTDAAAAAGLGDDMRRQRQAVAPFDPNRSFHAARVGGRLCAKGAPEALLPRCVRLRRDGEEQPLDDDGRQALATRGRILAARGLRVLLVAEGPAGASVEDPVGLTALGFLGISDPLRPTVPGAVRRCRSAGVRVIMITGDHPATARAVAREAGLTDREGDILTGAELAELQNGDLDRRLARTTVVARATPLDKLRIVESLRRLGHTVAMTGDGVNDAPALRLADVGVAMGRGGTDVARQAADVVLADDDFSTLVEGFVEGRGFWRNMRRGLGLLLGGNVGELALIVGASVLGLAPPLNTAQILVVNLITDALPALAVVLQPPEHRNLTGLAREGASAMDASLGRDVARRGTATAGPALAAYLLGRRLVGVESANAVAFGSIVATQLSQTLDAGQAEKGLTGPVLGAVGGSAGMLLAALTFPPLRRALGLALPGFMGWALMGGASLAAVAVSRALAPPRPAQPGPPQLEEIGQPVQLPILRLLADRAP